MSKASYDLMLPEIMALPDDQIVRPRMPIHTIIQEASDLHLWMQDDLELLQQAGLSSKVIEQLPDLTEALSYAQSKWNTHQNQPAIAVTTYQQQRQEAEQLRRELIHELRFAFRNQPDLQRKVKSRRGRMNPAALIQDLYDLSVLGLAHWQPSMSSLLSQSKLELAASTSSSLSHALAAANESKLTESEELLIRNKAYTLLLNTVKNIRRTGKYVFRNNPSKQKGYLSHYWNETKRRSSPIRPTDKNH